MFVWFKSACPLPSELGFAEDAPLRGVLAGLGETWRACPSRVDEEGVWLPFSGRPHSSLAFLSRSLAVPGVPGGMKAQVERWTWGPCGGLSAALLVALPPGCRRPPALCSHLS